MKICVLGQGYVGLPLATRAVEIGWTVVGYDIDKVRIARLAVGESYVEDVSASALARALDTGRYLPTTDVDACDGFDLAIITVPTPLTDGVPDLSAVRAAAVTLAPRLRPGSIVALESTTYPGTTEELLAPILEGGSGLVAGRDFHLGYSPERIDPGNQTWNVVNTPKVVSGVNPTSLAALQWCYEQLVETVVPVSSPRVAELTKLLENTFRQVNIALVNELAMFAHYMNIDIWEVVHAASSKPFGFMPFTPGPGVGGHCLPIDPSYLSWRVKRSLGHTFRFVELANDINDHMPDYVVRRLIEALNRAKKPVNGSRVLLLGLAYKKNTGDARESPAQRVIELLIGLGAELAAADPHVVEGHIDDRVCLVEATVDEVRRADATVVLTDHDSFNLTALAPHASLMLDCRHSVTGSNVEVL